jgi:hypothetical protein
MIQSTTSVAHADVLGQADHVAPRAARDLGTLGRVDSEVIVSVIIGSVPAGELPPSSVQRSASERAVQLGSRRSKTRRQA